MAWDTNLTNETEQLIKKSNKIHLANHSNKVWFGRCIFLSWYCDVGDCKFCYRSTQKSKIKHAEKARRSLSSILVEVILAKKLGWRIEFLTGGYNIFPFEDLIDYTKSVSNLYKEKIWLNLGALKQEELIQFQPSVKGIVASIETINTALHNKICPNKPIQPYIDMFNFIDTTGSLKSLKKSITIVMGLGEKREHINKLHNFIQQHKLDRITFYALRPIKGTPYTKEPTTEDYVWWIAQTRLKFPKLQIIAGTSKNRVEEISLILKAGANAITKFPATKMFNSKQAKVIEQQITLAGRQFTSTLTKIPNINIEKETETIDEKIRNQVKQKLSEYITNMKKEK